MPWSKKGSKKPFAKKTSYKDRPYKKVYGKYTHKKASYKKVSFKRSGVKAPTYVKSSYKGRPFSARKGTYLKKKAAQKSMFCADQVALLTGVKSTDSLALASPQVASSSVLAAAHAHAASSSIRFSLHYYGKDGPLPYSYFTKMLFAFDFGISELPPLNDPTLTVFSGNGMFTPLYNNSNVHVQYWTEFGNLYTQYRVHGSKMKGYFQSSTTAATGSTMVTVFPTILPPATWSAAIPPNAPALATWTAPHKSVEVSMLTSGRPTSHIDMYCATKDIWGVPDLADVGLCADTTNPVMGNTGDNPVWQFYWGCCYSNYTDEVTAPVPTGSITLEYYVEFFNPFRGTDIEVEQKGDVPDSAWQEVPPSRTLYPSGDKLIKDPTRFQAPKRASSPAVEAARTLAAMVLEQSE